MNYDFDYYSGNRINYPVKPTKPLLGRNPSSIEAKAWAEALEEYEREMKAYNEDISWCRSEKAQLLKEFQDKLRSDYGLSESAFSVLWNEAYNRGHSGGLYEVYHEFDSLFEFLIKWGKVSG